MIKNVKMTLIIRLMMIAANFPSSVILTGCGERVLPGGSDSVWREGSQVSPTPDKVPTVEQLKVCGLNVNI